MKQRSSRRIEYYNDQRPMKGSRFGRFFSKRWLAPAELFLSSFFVLIVSGTLGLMFLPGLYQGEPLGWTDAVFTSTSAVCVTGLIVVDTATYFTFAGQLLILLLIQLGGLGMLILTSVIIDALGKKISLNLELATADTRKLIPQVPARVLILNILRFTFLIEAVGALIIYLIWAPRIGWIKAIWPSIFHSISAFCNAGFSTNTDSLMGYHNSPGTILVIAALIVMGGLGFVTVLDIGLRFGKSKRTIKRISVHSQLVLWTTGILILGGWFLFACFEWNALLGEMSILDKLSNALFMSVTPRTAGFNTIDYGSATDSTNLLTIILMMIGGSPGSTAGGLKTTTFALLGLLAWSRLRSQSTTTFASRSIPDETIQRATGLFVIWTTIVVVSVFMMALIGDYWGFEQRFLVRLFETVSAFNTVGLSMGLTDSLSLPSRWLLIVLMFIGRTGPLVIASALIVRLSHRSKFRLAHEDVIVG
ncbi:TrkH family potassium uptake protein [Gimesia sp.]|uniref:TrkH family potassium uptake protein n=1 Tax=Gimesia sp. TaxID=2024833 RepID=UPI003A94876D